MLSMPCFSLRKMVPLFGCAMLLGFTVPGRADPKPLSKEEHAKVDKAIDKGVAFLKGAQTKEGDWQWKMFKDGRYLVGQCALPAYALLESGLPADDPVIQRAAEYIRPRVITDDQTYELSLAILFFDRLGDPKDKKLIKSLALRLIAGQYRTGGWSYRCPMLSEKSEQDLLGALEELNKRMRHGGKTRDQALKDIEVQAALKSLTIFQTASSLQWREPPYSPGTQAAEVRRVSLDGRTDNSNTQFGILDFFGNKAFVSF